MGVVVLSMSSRIIGVIPSGLGIGPIRALSRVTIARVLSPRLPISRTHDSGRWRVQVLIASIVRDWHTKHQRADLLGLVDGTEILATHAAGGVKV